MNEWKKTVSFFLEMRMCFIIRFSYVSFRFGHTKVLRSDLLLLQGGKQTKFTEIHITHSETALNVTGALALALIRSFCWQRFGPQWKLVKLECKTHGVDFHLHLTHHNFAHQHQPTFSFVGWIATPMLFHFSFSFSF